MKQCSWCDKPFKSNISYQIYCSSDCRTFATKEKIVERHKILKRKKRKNKKRLCAGGCGINLSIYNDDTMCNSCYISQKILNKKIKEIKDLMHEYEDDTK